jgi:hypothetical protein
MFNLKWRGEDAKEDFYLAVYWYFFIYSKSSFSRLRGC